MKSYLRGILGKIVNFLLSASDIDQRIMSASRKSYQMVLKESSQDINQQLNLNALKSTVYYVENHLLYAKSVDNKFELYDYILDKFTSNDGIFCEFGVYKGETINYIASKIDCKIHGFDSFDGLPEFWRSGYEEGIFKINDSEMPEFKSNVCLHVGLFENTLKEFVITHQQPISFLHIDCDLYSSTKTIFSYLENRFVEGTIIVFDEYFNYPGWQQHEFKAFQEFVKLNQIGYEYLCYNKHHEQVAIQITRCPSLNNQNQYHENNLSQKSKSTTHI